MIRSAATFVFLTLLMSTVHAEEADKPALGKVFYPDSIRFVTVTSENREVATMLFDNFVLTTSDGKGELLESRTKSFSVANKIEAKGAVSVTLDIRGFVSNEEGGSTALIVQAGGRTTLVDLSKAIEAAASRPRDPEDAQYAAAKESGKAAGFTVSSRPKKCDDFMVRIPADLAKGQPLQATVLLLADRLPDAGSEAMITVDSIDISVKADSSPKKTEKPAAIAKTEKKTAGSSEKKETSTKKSTKKTDADEKTAAEEPAEKKPAAKKSASEKSASEKSTSEKSTDEKPAEAKSSRKKSADEKPAEKKSDSRKASEEKKSDS